MKIFNNLYGEDKLRFLFLKCVKKEDLKTLLKKVGNDDVTIFAYLNELYYSKYEYDLRYDSKHLYDKGKSVTYYNDKEQKYKIRYDIKDLHGVWLTKYEALFIPLIAKEMSVDDIEQILYNADLSPRYCALLTTGLLKEQYLGQDLYIAIIRKYIINIALKKDDFEERIKYIYDWFKYPNRFCDVINYDVLKSSVAYNKLSFLIKKFYLLPSEDILNIIIEYGTKEDVILYFNKICIKNKEGFKNRLEDDTICKLINKFIPVKCPYTIKSNNIYDDKYHEESNVKTYIKYPESDITNYYMQYDLLDYLYLTNAIGKTDKVTDLIKSSNDLQLISYYIYRFNIKIDEETLKKIIINDYDCYNRKGKHDFYPLVFLSDYLIKNYNLYSNEILKTYLRYHYKLFYSNEKEDNIFLNLDVNDILKIIDELFAEFKKNINIYKKDVNKMTKLDWKISSVHHHIIYVIKLLQLKGLNIDDYVISLMDLSDLYIKKSNNEKLVSSKYILENIVVKDKNINKKIVKDFTGCSNEVDLKRLKYFIGEDFATKYKYLDNDNLNMVTSLYLLLDDEEIIYKFLCHTNEVCDINVIKDIIYNTNDKKYIDYFDSLCKENNRVLKR